MKKYIKEYMDSFKKFLNEEAAKADSSTKEKMLKELETKISYFQHERLIHLIVTVLFALMEIMSILAMFVDGNLVEIVLSAMFLILLVPYVLHYYFLENSVQEMYKLRDRLLELMD